MLFIKISYKWQGTFFLWKLILVIKSSAFRLKASADTAISIQLLVCSLGFGKNGQIFQTVQGEIINNVHIKENI